MSPALARALRILLRLAYAGALLACFATCGYFSFNVFVRSGATPAPNVVGLPEGVAADLLADQGLTLTRDDEGRFHAEIPAGAVILQRPSPRTLVKRGTEVEVVLSLGPERLRVPDLTGKALPAAQVSLAAAGLGLGRTLEVVDRRRAGIVVEQVPAPGEPVAPLTSVDLLLSAGSRAETYIMPDLVYRDYYQIRARFERRGFRFGSVKFERYEGAPAGLILRQFPLAGHALTPRDAVALVVAAPVEAGADVP